MKIAVSLMMDDTMNYLTTRQVCQCLFLCILHFVLHCIVAICKEVFIPVC